MTRANRLIDDLTTIQINHMHKSQSIQMNSNSIQVNLKKENASRLSDQLVLEDGSQISLNSPVCSMMGLGSSCSDRVLTQRVNKFFN